MKREKLSSKGPSKKNKKIKRYPRVRGSCGRQYSFHQFLKMIKKLIGKVDRIDLNHVQDTVEKLNRKNSKKKTKDEDFLKKTATSCNENFSVRIGDTNNLYEKSYKNKLLDENFRKELNLDLFLQTVKKSFQIRRGVC